MNNILKDYKPEVIEKKGVALPKEKPPQGEQVFTTTQRNADDISALRLFEYFNVSDAEKLDRTKKQKLNLIWQYGVNMAGSPKKADVLIAIKKLEKKLNVAPLGTDRIGHLYNYIKLQNATKRLEHERKVYEK
jgi:hypothetical protein